MKSMASPSFSAPGYQCTPDGILPGRAEGMEITAKSSSLPLVIALSPSRPTSTPSLSVGRFERILPIPVNLVRISELPYP
jgi:hypothetical protein